jgi:hypothetical protein
VFPKLSGAMLSRSQQWRKAKLSKRQARIITSNQASADNYPDDYVYHAAEVDPQILKLVTQKSAAGFIRFAECSGAEGVTSDDSISSHGSSKSASSPVPPTRSTSSGPNRVCFEVRVKVCLVPSRTGMQGDFDSLFWSGSCYAQFKAEALEELREYWAKHGHLLTHAKQAITGLYQPSAEDLLPPGVAASSPASTSTAASASTSAAPALEASRLVLLSKSSLSAFNDQGSNDDEMSDTTHSTRSSDADAEADQKTGCIHTSLKALSLKAGTQADADSTLCGLSGRRQRLRRVRADYSRLGRHRLHPRVPHSHRAED